MNLSEEAEKNKYLEEKLEMCEKEKDAVSKANKILEENYKILDSVKLVRLHQFIKQTLNYDLQAMNHTAKYKSQESSNEVTIIKKELTEQDSLIVLLKSEIGSYKRWESM